MRRVVLATKNPGKLREVAAILEGTGVELVGMDGLPDPPEETGDTFLENALAKGAFAAVTSGLWAIADDSGLVVEAIGGRPGVHSARYAGPGHDHHIQKLLWEMALVKDRRARFVCTAVLVGPRAELPHLSLPNLTRVEEHPALPPGMAAVVATGEVWGLITEAPSGTGGFGYDPVFYHEGERATFAEIPESRKNELSHRGQAFRALRAFLELAAKLHDHRG